MRKTRLHFHEFMREVHRELQDLKGTVDPLDELGRRIARRFRLICFDEFHVADVTDAMILHRLLDALFANRVSIVDDLELPSRRAVSERPAPRPHPAGDRAAEGQARDRRRRQRRRLPAPHAGAGAAVPHAARRGGRRRDGRRPSTRLAEAREDDPVLHIEHRELRARRRAGGVVWFDFRTLCGGPRSQNDYLEIASRFHTAAAVRRAGDVAAPGLRGAALHLARRCALRPPRQAHHVGRGASPRSCTPKGRSRTSSRAPCRA